MKINEKDFESFLTVKQNLASKSVTHCMIRIRVINKWFANKELTKENIEHFFLEYKERGRKNNSLNTYRFVFRHLVDYCKDRGIPHDFFSGFKPFKRTKPDIIIFTLEEIDKIINTPLKYGKYWGLDTSFLDFRYRTMTMFLAYTGCRYAEAAELQVKRLDLSAGKAIFINTKTNENRTVYVTEPLISNLKELVKDCKPCDFVFRNATEKKVQVTDFSNDLKKRAKAAGVTKRVFPHNFRHSYITHMLEAGVPITEVAMLVGHKDIRTTYSTYMHLADKTLQRAAMRHPMVRQNVDPYETIRVIRDTLENYHFENDQRFRYRVTENGGKFYFSLEVK